MTQAAAQFPTAVATVAQLYASTSAGKAGVPYTLAGAHTAVTATILTNEALDASTPTAGTLLIDNEQITYTGTGASSFTGCTRGANTTYGAGAAASHNGNANVYVILSPVAYSQAVSEVINIEKALASQGTIASAATTDMATTTSQYVQVTGVTTITAFGTMPAGTLRILEFAGILTLTHNGTSLIMRSGTNATTAAGDIYAFASEGSGNWRELWHLTSAGAGSVISWSAANVAQPANTTGYWSYMGGANATEINSRFVMPRAGNVARLFVTTNTSQPAGGALVFTMMKNNVPQTVTLTISANAGAGTFSDTTNSFAVVAGDEVSVRVANGDAANASAQVRSIAFQIA